LHGWGNDMPEDFQPIGYDELPDAVKSVLKPDMPVQARMAAADGVVPLTTGDLVLALYYLIGDPEKEVAEQARKTFVGLPAELLVASIDLGLPPKILDFIGRNVVNRVVLEKIVLSPNAPDSVLEYIAAKSDDASLLELVGSNQKRWLRYPDIARNLVKNPNSPTALVHRIRDMMRLEAITLDGVAVGEGGEVNIQSPALDEVKDISQKLEKGEEPLEVLKDEASENLPDFARGLLEEHLELGQDERNTLYDRIKQMRPVDQMRLAMLGGMEARLLLIRSPIRMVQESVLRNPKITMEEIIRIARNKSMREDIISSVAKNRDWIRNYRVVCELAQNPKTPVHLALRFLERLYDRDLIHISRSKQVPGMVAATAKRIYSQRQKKHI